MLSLSKKLVKSAGIRSLATAQRSMSSAVPDFWKDVEEAPRDPILGVTEKFLADQNPDKMNLGVGAYRDDDGNPVVLQCVREAEKQIMGNKFMEYLPMGGFKEFCDHSIKLAYGDDNSLVKANKIAAVQSLSGTGSCRLMADFMKKFKPGAKVYITVPTWSNHHNIWGDAGVEKETFRYYKPETRGLDFDGMMEDIAAAEGGSFFLLHACAHNPTGVDPTADQWKEVSKLMREKGHFPFFDMAYQGFASGDCVKDAQAIDIFLKDGHMVGCSQSYAKNMGLYGQRIGCFSLTCNSEEEKTAVESQMKRIARATYSNPPLHGALLVSTVLGDPALKALWYDEVKGMADRIIGMRSSLRENLEKVSGDKWQHVTDQIGMFCFTGMTPEQVDAIYEKSIYMTRNGRISMAGVTTKNVERLAKAIIEVTST
ncbi:aspartate aminotransferase [Chloropicon primus]|uniref:Aspartate aminotransferase n=1 Tax=Chloropicon primus TaxID=1764295 RepID=A0A5B8MRP7_9CHLO|nr:aspartate aminotransferase [Chloropicon primus]UPR02295.1 aspartate aminotransferase [Chloropicon primus]|mmetsp:Transcript_18149/g.37466  ORF Transcript_18149/g.37466 Transcript_18149/m.37466 type:complete len:427 (-) Transcript_18149:140-1420(-)|eukprot:QDZ23081.1 aspartate aminotransferase [Chloropicon primus]